MANNKSAKKRILIAKRNYLENRKYINGLRSAVKNFLRNIEICNQVIDQTVKEETRKKIMLDFKLINKILDKGIKKNVFHKNTVARKKSRFSTLLKKIQ